MNRSAIHLMAGLCVLIPAIAGAQAAPGFSLPGRQGNVNLADYRGKFVYVDFWASWCAPCKHSFPWMGELQKRYAAHGLQVVAINVDTRREDADQFLASVPAGFTIAYDPAGATPKSYAIKGMPSSVLVDPSGRIVFQHAGFTEDAAARIEAKIREALQAKGAQ